MQSAYASVYVMHRNKEKKKQMFTSESKVKRNKVNCFNFD